jgi:isopenicillin N synthase-like dioxygenase
MMGFSDELPMPDVITRNRPLFQSIMTASHSISLLILQTITERLGLPADSLTSLHRFDTPSGDLIRIIKSHPPTAPTDGSVALPPHTDYGSVTVLFNRLGGLQVLAPGETEWAYVRPLPGHAIVNIGDSLVKFTGGLLRSNFHRIVSPPGEQATLTRYSVLYFCRPNDDVVLRPVAGLQTARAAGGAEEEEAEEITSKQWILRRALGRRANLPFVDWDAIGGTEPVKL